MGSRGHVVIQRSLYYYFYYYKWNNVFTQYICQGQVNLAHPGRCTIRKSLKKIKIVYFAE